MPFNRLPVVKKTKNMKWDWILNAKKRCENETALLSNVNGGDFSAVVVYPDVYYTGMSNLGFQSVYALLRTEFSVNCERAFYPDREFADFFRENRNLRSQETQKPLQEFELIAFSVSFELNYPLIPDILKMTSVPLYANMRGENDPFVACGGAVSCINPEPLADFMDFVVIGRAEDTLFDAVQILKDSSDRHEKLRRLALLPNIYVPSLMTLKSAVRKKYNSRVFFSSSIMTPETEFADTFLTEIMRGCPFKCSYCTVSNCFGDVMFRPAKELLSDIDKNISGVSKVGLIGGSINVHPEFADILSALRKRGLKVGFSSLRADRLTPVILDFIMHEGCRVLTLAPECADEKLRLSIGKNLKDDAFYDAAGMAFNAGIEHLRLYFMLGLPGETQEDAFKIAEMLQKLRRLPKGSQVKITVSVSQFVPKPFTPLENSPQEAPESVLQKINLVKSNIPKGVKVSFENPFEATLQGIFTRGDRRLSHLMANNRELSYKKWDKAALKENIKLTEYLSERQTGDDFSSPWR